MQAGATGGLGELVRVSVFVRRFGVRVCSSLSLRSLSNVTGQGRSVGRSTFARDQEYEHHGTVCPQMPTFSPFAGTSLHENAHARTGDSDVTCRFDSERTILLGVTAGFVLSGSSEERSVKLTLWRRSAARGWGHGQAYVCQCRIASDRRRLCYNGQWPTRERVGSVVCWCSNCRLVRCGCRARSTPQQSHVTS